MEALEGAELERLVVEKDCVIDELKKRGKEKELELSKNKTRIEELEMEGVERQRELECSRVKELEMEMEIEKLKQYQLSIATAFAAKNRELDSVEFELQESKIEMATLYEKMELLESMYKNDNGGKGLEEVWHLENELKMAQNGERHALLTLRSLESEMERLRHDYQQAVEGEDRTAKAMEDLALALQEVASERKAAQENLTTMEAEIQRLKSALTTTEHLLHVAQQDHRNEVEEMLLAWNAKEMGFVGCIKRAEADKASALHENNRLAELLKAAQITAETATQETNTSRDMLKQAVAAAEVARDDYSELLDTLAEKQEELHYLTKENQRLRISEAAAQEAIKQLKSMLSASAVIQTAADKDNSDTSSLEDNEDQEDNGRNMPFNPEEPEFLDTPTNLHLKVFDDDPEKAEALKGSIFDMTAVTPKSESHTPEQRRRRRRSKSRRRHSFSYTEVNHMQNSQAYYHSELDDTTSAAEKLPHPEHSHRRVKTMFRRVGWPILAIGKVATHRKLPSSSADNVGY